MFREEIEWEDEKKEKKYKEKKWRGRDKRNKNKTIFLKMKQQIKWPIKGYISRGSESSPQDIREKSYWFWKNKNYYQRDLGMELDSTIFYLHENEEVTKPLQAVCLTCKF